MISIIISTHGDGADLPIILGCLDRQRRYFPGKIKNNVGTAKFREVKYLPGPYLKPLSPRNTTHKDVQPLIEPIIVCHGEFNYSSLECYTTGYDSDLGETFNDFKFRQFPHKKNTYGHQCREEGIKEASGDWIVLTNSDNLFFAWWYNTIKPYLRPENGIISWNILNNYWKNGPLNVKYDLKTIKRGNIDMMCVCVKASIAKTVGFKWRTMSADYDYIYNCYKECEKQGLKTVHTNQLLGVHQ